MKKRILALILSLTMIFAVSAVNLPVMAKTTDPSITLESVDGESGQDVSIKVLIDNNPGIWGMDLRISYDKNVLTLTSIDNGDFYQDTEWTKGNLNSDVYILSYEASGLDNITTQSGTLATLNFKVSDTAVAGDYAVTASYNPGDIINVEFDDIDFNITNGKVTIKAKPVSATGVTLNKTTLSLGTGASETLIATVSPDNATNKTVKWESSDTTVATVDNNGQVTALKKGTATITVTTEDGEFPATCVVSVACSHTDTTVHPAVASTCQVQGNDEYTTCDDCGVVISGSDAKLPLAGHTYTEKAEAQYLKSAATCKAKAVYYKSCSVCGVKGSETFEYGKVNPDNHTGVTYLKDQKEATCYEEGYTGDTYCNDCDVKIKDGTVIEKSAHNPASVWTTDETDHWKVCQTVGCGNIIDKAPHSGGEATCVAKAVCSVCGVQYGEVNASNHKHTEVRNAKAATCCEAGYTGDTWCTDCNTKIANGTVIPATGKHVDVDGKWETDGTSHWHTCYFGTKFDITAHSGGEATCKDKAICSVCSTAYGKLDTSNHKGNTYLKDQKEATCYEEGYTGDTYCSDCDVKIKDGTVIAKSAHNPASVWTTDETNHWKVCQTIGCGNIIDKAPHSGGEATCKDKAICSVCGAEYGELDSTNHTHTEVRDAKAATEQEKGYTGDTWCLDCNKKIAEGKDIEMLEHKPVLVKAEEATAAKEGNIEYYYCENCGKYYSDETGTKEIAKKATVIAKLAPKIIDGNNAKVDKSSKEPVSFRSDAAFADFIRVELDGKELVRDKDYTLKEGSIIASLTPEFVATLTAGEHTLGIVSASGTAVANFTVTVDNASNTISDKNSVKSPQTGDNSHIILWSIVAVISLAALCTTAIVSKKKKVR